MVDTFAYRFCQFAKGERIETKSQASDNQVNHPAIAHLDLDCSAFGEAPPLTILPVRHLASPILAIPILCPAPSIP